MSRVAIALAHVFSARLFDPQKANRRSQFDVLAPPPPDRVLFLGDSITQFAEWAEWFPDLQTLNRGIDGDTVRGVAARLDAAINRPRAVSLLIGTNDIGGIGDSADPDKIADAAHRLVRDIRSAAPGIPLLLTGVMPRSASFATSIRRLNERLRTIAESERAIWVDVWGRLADERGEIRPEFSNDRLHLTGEGYNEWVSALRPQLEDL